MILDDSILYDHGRGNMKLMFERKTRAIRVTPRATHGVFIIIERNYVLATICIHMYRYKYR